MTDVISSRNIDCNWISTNKAFISNTWNRKKIIKVTNAISFIQYSVFIKFLLCCSSEARQIKLYEWFEPGYFLHGWDYVSLLCKPLPLTSSGTSIFQSYLFPDVSTVSKYILVDWKCVMTWFFSAKSQASPKRVVHFPLTDITIWKPGNDARVYCLRYKWRTRVWVTLNIHITIVKQ